MIQVQLPYFIDLRTSTGIHETYTEQHVPLIVVSKINQDMIPYPIGTIIDEQVGVIDIIPTITHLNGCGSEDTFDGTTFLIYQRFKNMYNNAKNSFLI